MIILLSPVLKKQLDNIVLHVETMHKPHETRNELPYYHQNLILDR